jgi:uncharacterized protein
MRKLFEDKATLQSKVLTDKETEGIKYKDYFDFSEPIHRIPRTASLPCCVVSWKDFCACRYYL